jgi:hypothetical protein
LIVIVTRLVLPAGTASIAACTVRYVPLPSAATVGVATETGVNSHCLFVFAEQDSCTIGTPEPVPAFWLARQSPLATLTIW